MNILNRIFLLVLVVSVPSLVVGLALHPERIPMVAAVIVANAVLTGGAVVATRYLDTLHRGV